MASPRQELEGRRYHKLTVLAWAEWRQYSGGRESTWKCVCDCGKECIVPQRNLVGGNTKSCGCIIGKHKRTHGATGTPEFRCWESMLRRCRDPKNDNYHRYGGRGIQVCERWLKFENFLADMEKRPSAAHSLDRKDNDGNYQPSNCRWATGITQSNNRRSSRFLTIDGKTKTYAEWEHSAGLKPGTVFQRLKMGWAAERILSPMRVYRRGVERVTALGL